MLVLFTKLRLYNTPNVTPIYYTYEHYENVKTLENIPRSKPNLKILLVTNFKNSFIVEERF